MKPQQSRKSYMSQDQTPGSCTCQTREELVNPGSFRDCGIRFRACPLRCVRRGTRVAAFCVSWRFLFNVFSAKGDRPSPLLRLHWQAAAYLGSLGEKKSGVVGGYLEQEGQGLVCGFVSTSSSRLEKSSRSRNAAFKGSVGIYDSGLVKC